MFGLIYALLFALWIFVLNNKIQHGPDEGASIAAGDAGFLGAAASRAARSESMTETHDAVRDEPAA